MGFFDNIRNLCILRGDVYNRDPKTLRPTSEPFMYKGAHVHFTEDIQLVKTDNTIDVGNNTEAKQQGCHSIKWFIVPQDYNNGRNRANGYSDHAAQRIPPHSKCSHSGGSGTAAATAE